MDPIAEHITHLEQGRYSSSTLKARRRVLETLGDDPLGIDREAMQAWWATMQTRQDGHERAASSLSGAASHVRRFFRWAMMQGLIDRNPADWLDVVRQKHPDADPVTEGDLYRIIAAAKPPMHQMIALAAMAGLRSAEIATIKWEDIDHGNGVLRVREGKGSKDRTVPLSAGLLAELGDPGKGPIVGKTMNAKAVSAAIGRYLRSCGTDGDYTAHKLRARYATRFLAATGDAVAAAEALGHADLSSIKRYAVASSDTMRRGAEAAGRIG